MILFIGINQDYIEAQWKDIDIFPMSTNRCRSLTLTNVDVEGRREDDLMLANGVLQLPIESFS